MPEKPKPKPKIDIDGSDIMSRVLADLLNRFPGLNGRPIAFATLSESSGIAMFPTSGAAVQEEHEDITGSVNQICLYPFTIVYRSAPKDDDVRMQIKEFLDTIGRWLEQQPVVIGNSTRRLTAYPEMATPERVFKSIRRSGPGHLDVTYENGVEDWIIQMSLRYEFTFQK